MSCNRNLYCAIHVGETGNIGSFPSGFVNLGKSLQITSVVPTESKVEDMKGEQTVVSVQQEGEFRLFEEAAFQALPQLLAWKGECTTVDIVCQREDGTFDYLQGTFPNVNYVANPGKGNLQHLSLKYTICACNADDIGGEGSADAPAISSECTQRTGLLKFIQLRPTGTNTWDENDPNVFTSRRMNEGTNVAPVENAKQYLTGQSVDCVSGIDVNIDVDESWGLPSGNCNYYDIRFCFCDGSEAIWENIKLTANRRKSFNPSECPDNLIFTGRRLTCDLSETLQLVAPN